MIPVVAGEYKLVLVGDSAVGKSSLLSQFVDGKYDQHLLSTIGVDFKFRRVKVRDDEIKLQIWDTAGQETFRSIVSAYYNSADAILLCYDIGNYQSFESMKDYWLVQATENNKNNAKIFVIGNKADGKREVESFSLEPLKSNNIEAFYEVSAKMNIKVQETFVNIASILHSGSGKASEAKNKSEKIKSTLKSADPKSKQESTAPRKSCCK